MNNGTKNKRGLLSDLSAMLSDQAELASLEMRYESVQACRRAVALMVAGLFGLSAFAIAQMVVLHALVHVGLTWLVASLVLMGIDGLLALVIF